MNQAQIDSTIENANKRTAELRWLLVNKAITQEQFDASCLPLARSVELALAAMLENKRSR